MKTVKLTERQKQMAMVGAFALFLLALGIWLVIVPAFEKSARLRQETAQMGRKHELLKQIEDNQKRIHNLEKDFLQAQERHLILSHVTTLANRAGLEVESVNPDKTGVFERGMYAPFAVRLNAMSTFERALAFLGALERKKPKLAVVGLEMLQSPASRRQGVLSVSAVVQTLLLTSQDTDGRLR